MLMYCKVIDAATGTCSVGVGSNSAFYEKLGMTKQNVELGSDGVYYLAGFAPIEADSEWVDLEAFITALSGLIPADTLQATLFGSASALKTGVAGLALLTTNAVRNGRINLIDSRVEPFLTTFGLTTDAVRSAMNTTTE